MRSGGWALGNVNADKTMLCYYENMRGLTLQQKKDLHESLETIWGCMSIKPYTSTSEITNTWNKIFTKIPSNVVKLRDMKQLGKSFKLWTKVLDIKHKQALHNYAKFHGLNRLPRYNEVKISSAGLEGWKHYNHYTHKL